MMIVALLSCLSLLCGFAYGQNDDSLYQRRRGHSIAVLKDRLYIDGGVMSNVVDGKLPNGANGTRVVTNISSIPLTMNWKNTDVQEKIIEYGKKVTPMWYSALWVDANSSRLHRWGGERADGSLALEEDQVLWTLEVGDGTGAGTWSSEPARDYPPAVYGTPTTCAGLHLYFGGDETTRSYSKATQEVTPLQGVLEYNLTSQEWKRRMDENGTLPGAFRTTHVAQAICLEGFTASPLVLLFGGRYRNPTTLEVSSLGVQSVVLYDPLNHQWYNQSTTGAPSGGRDNFCAVGAKGQNGTYEIYAFGGDYWGTKKDVCILTLPAFHWICPEGASTDGRLYHQCALAGERQMISVGGLSAYNNMSDKDTWAHNLGILDLPSLTWKDNYDANAGAYDSPSVVKNEYAKGNLGKTNWGHPDLEAFFAMTSDSPDKPTNQTSDETNENKPGTNVGAIAGGVVGGVAFIAIIAAALWWFRRRRRASDAQEHAELAVADAENDMGTDSHIKNDFSQQIPPPPSQLDAGNQGLQWHARVQGELEATSRSELDGSVSLPTYASHTDSTR